ncbi:hypothetical protein [Paenibacillus algorifonticola]|uniref:hypothetical protein n=1 Tax=Paenibacillus algorifonticola TaxID=684063 RepID=UPI000943E9E3|nr:hypothetical protein [Paenibacillus algorifonticola]
MRSGKKAPDKNKKQPDAERATARQENKSEYDTKKKTSQSGLHTTVPRGETQKTHKKTTPKPAQHNHQHIKPINQSRETTNNPPQPIHHTMEPITNIEPNKKLSRHAKNHSHRDKKAGHATKKDKSSKRRASSREPQH